MSTYIQARIEYDWTASDNVIFDTKNISHQYTVRLKKYLDWYIITQKTICYNSSL